MLFFLFLLFKKRKWALCKSLGIIFDYSLLLFKSMITKAQIQLIYTLGLQWVRLVKFQGWTFYSEVSNSMPFNYPTAVAVLSGVL